MEKPVIIAVDDGPEVVDAVMRDLRLGYGEHYQIVRAESGQVALEAANQLRLRNRSVALFLVDQRMPHMSGIEFLEQAMALFLVDQRMPHMSGIEFLEQAMALFPEAKRVLLTAYADVAIRAINKVQLDYYLLKPWHPPELSFYPVLDDLLDAWQAAWRGSFKGIRLIDHRWSAQGHQLRDFMARNHIPYQWLDVANGSAAEGLLNSLDPATRQLPILIFEDGTALSRPTIGQIADKVGLTTHSTTPFYEMLIVGGGPAGLAAAVYGASEGLKSAIIEQKAPVDRRARVRELKTISAFPPG